MNAVIYCRVSTLEQTKNLSLPTQKVACQRYCEQHGYRVVKEFVDAGESAKTTERPELQRMLDYCQGKKNKVQVLVVYNVSRFARNVEDHIALRFSLLRSEIKLRSVTEYIDETATGQLMEHILSSFAQFDNNQKAERTKAGMITALERGRWTFQAPLGYRRGGRDGPSLLPDVLPSELIRMAFNEVVQGVSLNEARRRVSRLGLRSRKGKSISAQSFHKMLRNPIYAGRIEAMRVSTDGDFEPIVESMLFDRVQQVLNGRGRQESKRKSSNTDFPLRHFVRCGNCDRPLTGSWSRGRPKRYAYYHCYRCQSVRVRGGQLETEFLALLERLRPEPKFLRLFDAIVRDVWAQRQQMVLQGTAVAERQVENLQSQLIRLDEAHIFDRTVDKQSYLPLRDKLRGDLRDAELELMDESFEDLDIETALTASGEVLSNAAELWRGATLTQRTELQVALFPDGLAHDGQKFRTATTCLGFSGLLKETTDLREMASPRGIEPLLPG